MTQKYLPYARQHISEEDLEAVRQALIRPIITRGELVENFEQAIANYCQAAYGVAFNTGTAALMAAYYAADIGPHDRLLTTPNTFVSTVGSATQQGAVPVFVDIDRATGNIDIDQVVSNVNKPTSRGKTVIVPVHFSGIPVDMKVIYKSLSDHRSITIEDAAHALGSCYRDGTKVGSCEYSDMTMFSFHPAKTITTGEGGMVLTNNEKFYQRLKTFRNNGIERNAEMQESHFMGYYEVVASTGNYNVTEMQAALGLSQLKQIDKFIEKRRKLLSLYKELLSNIEHVRLCMPQDEAFVAPHLCVVQINFDAYRTDRATVMKKLDQKNIGTQVHYIPVYRHPFFVNKAGDISEYFPEMETYYSQTLSLPLFFDLTEEEVKYVVDNLKAALKGR